MPFLGSSYFTDPNDVIQDLKTDISLKDQQIEELQKGTDGLKLEIGELKKVLLEYRKRFGKL